ncbi:MAG: substrate-binding domain-containing protein, partial [Methanoregula sp.]
MKDKLTPSNLVLISIVCGLLMITALFAGCTQSTNTAAVATTVPTEAATAMPTPVATTTTAIPTTMATTATPVPTYTPSNSNLVAFTAASLTGASGTIGSSFTAAYPGTTVSFDLDGTQALKTQVENGAYADVFISASNSYTNTLTKEGYF